MARNNDRERTTRRAPKDAGRRTKKKVCIFCKDHMTHVDFKDVGLLRKFMSDRGKIRARRVSGNCAQHQRAVAVAIKTARELALLPYTQRTTSERPGARGAGRGGRGGGRGPDGGRPGDGARGPEVALGETNESEELGELETAEAGAAR
jgi:small subunit ribosomal protein S18